MKVLTVGSFDLIHPGHLRLFEACRARAGRAGLVVVGVNSDEFIASFKAPPTQPITDRWEMVAAMRLVDKVVINDSASLEGLLIRERPEYLLIGSDWAPPKDYLRQIGTTARWLDAHGVKLEYVPRDPTVSSTALKAAIRG